MEGHRLNAIPYLCIQNNPNRHSRKEKPNDYCSNLTLFQQLRVYRSSPLFYLPRAIIGQVFLLTVRFPYSPKGSMHTDATPPYLIATVHPNG